MRMACTEARSGRPCRRSRGGRWRVRGTRRLRSRLPNPGRRSLVVVPPDCARPLVRPQQASAPKKSSHHPASRGADPRTPAPAQTRSTERRDRRLQAAGGLSDLDVDATGRIGHLPRDQRSGRRRSGRCGRRSASRWLDGRPGSRRRTRRRAWHADTGVSIQPSGATASVAGPAEPSSSPTMSTRAVWLLEAPRFRPRRR